MKLAQQAALVRYFMEHRKDEGEIGLGIDPKPILLTVMQSDSVGPPAFSARRHSILSICCWRSTAITFPSLPTMLAIGIENQPTPQPTSITVMPGLT